MNRLLTKLTNIFRGSHKTGENFLDYPSEKQKKILKKAIEGANRQQMELERHYVETEAKARVR